MRVPKRIEVRIVEEDLQPGRMRSFELAEIIKSVEDAIASKVVLDHPELSKDEIVIGLLSIGDGSLSLRFASPLEQEVAPAFLDIVEAIDTDDYAALPHSSLESLRTITSIARRRNSDFEFRSLVGPIHRKARITPSTVIRATPPLRGMTTIYGQVIRVGGRDPRLMFETLAGEVVYCNIKRSLAKQLGQSLYSTVGLIGRAEWDSTDLSLLSFGANEVIKYERKSAVSTLQELASKVGEYFTDIEDVEGYVATIRGG